MLRLLQVREELLEVEKRVAEMDGNSDSATSEYARLKQVSLSPLPPQKLQCRPSRCLPMCSCAVHQVAEYGTDSRGCCGLQCSSATPQGVRVQLDTPCISCLAGLQESSDRLYVLQPSYIRPDQLLQLFKPYSLVRVQWAPRQAAQLNWLRAHQSDTCCAAGHLGAAADSPALHDPARPRPAPAPAGAPGEGAGGPQRLGLGHCAGGQERPDCKREGAAHEFSGVQQLLWRCQLHSTGEELHMLACTCLPSGPVLWSTFMPGVEYPMPDAIVRCADQRGRKWEQQCIVGAYKQLHYGHTPGMRFEQRQ